MKLIGRSRSILDKKKLAKRPSKLTIEPLRGAFVAPVGGAGWRWTKFSIFQARGEATEKVQLNMTTLRVEVATFAGIRAVETYSGKCCHSSDFFSGFARGTHFRKFCPDPKRR